MSFKCSFSDFKELAQFMEKKANGSSLSIELNLEGHMIVRTSDSANDQVTITIFPEDVNYHPRITKTYRLTEETSKVKHL